MQRDDASSFDSEADSPVEPPLPDELFLREESTPTRGARRPALLWPVLLGVVLGAALGWPLEKGEPSGPGALLGKVLRLVEDRYVEPVDPDELVHRGIDEMLQTLDPNSRYISPEKVTEFEADTDGFFVGIGVVIEPARGDQPPRLQAVVPDSPAGRAELQHDDRLLEIDGVDVRTGTLDEVSQRLEGPPGSSVSLLIERPTDEGTRQIVTVVQRDRVSLPSVQAVRLYDDPDGAIGYVRLVQFQSDSTAEVRRALHNLTKAGASKFILDLRNNRGGYLDEAVRVCDLFIGSALILSTKGRRNPDKPELHRASGTTLYPTEPLVILIDRGSASASEIVAAALQDLRRALLVGEESYGKWSVQDVIHLDPGEGIVKLTTKSHHPPSGRWIRRDADGRRLGLSPNVETRIDRQARTRLIRSWGSELFEHIESPYEVVPTPRPTLEVPAEEGAVVDAALVRALEILQRTEDYQTLLALDPEPVANGSARSGQSKPRGSANDEPSDATVVPAVTAPGNSEASGTPIPPDGRR